MKNHWRNGRTHRDEFADDGITTEDEYVAAGMELVQSEVGGDIVGHIDGHGNVIRYNTKKNHFAKGNPEKGLTTFMKPEDRMAYYEDQKRGDLEHGGKA